MVTERHKGIDLVDFRIRHEREAKARERFYRDVDDGLMPHKDWAMAPLHVRQLYRSLETRAQAIKDQPFQTRLQRLRRFLISLLP